MAATPVSATHRHIAAVVATEATRRGWTGPATLVDAGCGSGTLIGHLADAEAGLDLRGFDVADYSAGGTEGFPASTIQRLRVRRPEVDWSYRIAVIAAGDPWPYNDESVDVVVTNQVLEHVTDLPAFLAEVRRVLAPGGFSVNVFPLRSQLYEGHLKVPLAAHIHGFDQREAFVRAAHRMGVGKHRSRDRGAAEASEYVAFSTWYRSFREVEHVSNTVGLRCAHRYTGQLARQKLRAATRRPPRTSYDPAPSALAGLVAFATCQWLWPVTVVLERPPAGSRFAHL